MTRIVGVMSLVVMAGCAIDPKESTTYSVPNWTGDGRIVASKTTMKSHKNLISSSVLDEYRQAIVVMDADGSNEHELFTVGDNGIRLIAMSASGNVVAYIGARLRVVVNEGGWREKWSVDINEGGARSYDNLQINPAESKLYASEGTYQFKVFSMDGTEVAHQLVGGGGGFKDNNTIVFNQTNLEIGYTSEFSTQTGLVAQMGRGFAFNLYVPSENAVIYLGGSYNTNYSEKLYFNSNTISTTNFSYSPYSYSDFTGRHLSPEGKKLIMSYDSVDDVGIYVLDIDRNRIDRLK